MSVSFTDRVRVPKDVLISRLQEESVLLNLDNESYYGLDDVGTRMLSVLTSSDSVQSAWLQLIDEYDVDREVLREDLVSLVERLLQQGLVKSRQCEPKIICLTILPRPTFSLPLISLILLYVLS